MMEVVFTLLCKIWIYDGQVICLRVQSKVVFIADLGYETYQKILTEAVRGLKTDGFAELYADEVMSDSKISGEQFVDECMVE